MARIENHPLIGLWTDVDEKPALVSAVFSESDNSGDRLLLQDVAGKVSVHAVNDVDAWDFFVTKEVCLASIAESQQQAA